MPSSTSSSPVGTTVLTLALTIAPTLTMTLTLTCKQKPSETDTSSSIALLAAYAVISIPGRARRIYFHHPSRHHVLYPAAYSTASVNLLTSRAFSDSEGQETASLKGRSWCCSSPRCNGVGQWKAQTEPLHEEIAWVLLRDWYARCNTLPLSCPSRPDHLRSHPIKILRTQCNTSKPLCHKQKMGHSSLNHA